MPRKSVSLDMTAMCDVAFLLLTFFMLTTSFKPEEPVTVDTPSATSEREAPDADNVLISVSKKGEVFFGIDGPNSRKNVLEYVGEKKGITFTDKQKRVYANLPSHGVPITQLKSFLDLKPNEQSRAAKKGIPCDTLKSPNNEFILWLEATLPERGARRLEKKELKYIIKGDGASNYVVMKNVIASLQALKINRFHLITNLEAKK